MKKAMVVTTEKRGVFFGYVEDDSKAPAQITLSQARMCVYWAVETKGVIGLAMSGPLGASRITHAIPSMIVYQVTAILECSPEAIAKWEEGLWK